MTIRIEAKQISFSYSRDLTEPVFQDVSFSVRSGEIFCLLGPNGTGKSTLLKCLMGVLGVQHGRVLINGKPVQSHKPAEIARTIGYVPQGLLSAFPFRIKDIVVMGRAPHLSVLASPSSRDMEIAYVAMENTGIAHLAERSCTNVSGGEWQLALIARALVQQPHVLLLDEPTSHLDLGNQMKILKVIRELSIQGMTILMASHSPDHAFLVAQSAAIMNRGGICRIGSPEEVLTEETLRETYGVEVRIADAGEGIRHKVCMPMLR